MSGNERFTVSVRLTETEAEELLRAVAEVADDRDYIETFETSPRRRSLAHAVRKIKDAVEAGRQRGTVGKVGRSPRL